MIIIVILSYRLNHHCWARCSGCSGSGLRLWLVKAIIRIAADLKVFRMSSVGQNCSVRGHRTSGDFFSFLLVGLHSFRV